jgi:hypothetical protein
VGLGRGRGIANLTASPYKYLDYYDLDDKDIFFGREPEIITFLADIVVSRLVVLFAKTGTGKTSLINAGVRPRLEERDYKTFIVQVRQDPVASLRKELGMINPPRGSLREELGYLSRKTYSKPLVIFFDQFEEFFTYIKADSPEGRRFISDISDIYEDQNSGVHIVFSMREEWFYELDAFRDKIPAIFHNESNLRLRWFSEAQAREAIKRPAEKFGVTIEDALVDKLISDLSDNGTVEPAQLQIICDALWREREHGLIRLSHYLKSDWHEGDSNIARQILYRRLEHEFDKIETEEQLRLLNRLLPQLRTPPPRSIKYVRDTVGLIRELETDADSLRGLIRWLESSQLIRTGRRDALPVIELLHDYLIDHLDTLAIRVKAVWPRRLLKAGLEAYGRDGGLLPPDTLAKVSDYLLDEEVKRLVLDKAGAELLFRSTLEYGMNMPVWFRLAARYEVPVWDILKETLHTGGGAQARDEDIVRASNAVYLLAQLLEDDGHASSAFELLREALGQRLLASTVVKNFEQHETYLAVELLRIALVNNALASQSREVLKGFAGSQNAKVASAARAVLNQSEVAEEVKPDLGERGSSRGKGEEAEIPRQFDDPLDTHLLAVSRGLVEGYTIAILGRDINCAGRPPDVKWVKGESLPTDRELALHLAEVFSYPPGEPVELARVAQYVKLSKGLGPLYEELIEIFDTAYSPTLVHRFCASLSAKFREKNSANVHPLRRRLVLVTTNYDRLLENAFDAAGETYHVLSYIAAGDVGNIGQFLHKAPGSNIEVLHGRSVTDLEGDYYPVIIKLYGSVSMKPLDSDEQYRHPGFVISEDDYLARASHSYIRESLPQVIWAMLRRSGFLVLGHRMSTWYERALLESIWRGEKPDYRSWAVNPHTNNIEILWLSSCNVDVINMNLEEYVEKLAAQIPN